MHVKKLLFESEQSRNISIGDSFLMKLKKLKLSSVSKSNSKGFSPYAKAPSGQ